MDAALVPVATGLSDFEAKLLAAQLGADGILWQTRGIVDSIYPFGGIDVLVPRSQLDEARHALALVVERRPDPLDPPVGLGIDGRRDRRQPAVVVRDRASWWFGIAALGAIVAMVTVRVLALA